MLCMFQHVILWHRNLAETRLPTLAFILFCFATIMILPAVTAHLLQLIERFSS